MADCRMNRAATLPLWPLPLLIAAIPVLAVHLAWGLSLRDGLVPACMPYLDGCISISRAARHGLGNDLFRMLMLPCAALQALFWLAVAHWLRRAGRDGGAMLPWLGLLAAVFLALYATYLGSEGAIYQTLRRYGVTVYFASTYVALLFSLRALRHAPVDAAARALLVVALGMLALGLASVAVSLSIEERALRYRLENVLEWQLGLWLTALFAVFAWRWRRLRVGLS